ncbi:MAG TPA: nuclear transport factor 2 family protein [Gaiellaceae bacterium]|jgi:ketosteroid isomerase-like protein|nr:nuclear transport factor 2 family protein [Gaiellaceae bacterium]
MTLEVRRLLDEYRAAWLAHDIDGIVALVGADVVYENLTNGVRVEGVDAFRAHVVETHERWPDFTFDEHVFYVAAETGVSEWTARATAPDGRRLEWDGVDIVTCRDGRVVRNAVYSTAHAPRPSAR